MRLVLGLDIGVTSVGYGVIDLDENKCIDYGVRLFKEGKAAENETRRTNRGARRLKSRKRNRISDMIKLLEQAGIKEDDYRPFDNPYVIREKGINEQLTNNELTCALLHLTKNRGSSFEIEEDDKGVTKEILQSNSKLLSEGKYICQIQLERLQNDGKIRGSINNFRTDDYIKETQQILNNQKLDEELKSQIINIIKRKRAYYDGPGSEKSPTPYGRWVDFGVEPINLIEKMRGNCSVFPDQGRAPKYAYTSELFNLLNDLNNLTINNEKITVEDKKRIIDEVNSSASMTVKKLCKLLNTDLENITGFRKDKKEKPLITDFKGYKAIKKVFDKHKDTSYVDNKEIIDDVVEMITKLKGEKDISENIKELHPDLDDDLVKDLSMVKGLSQYHSLSFKAMKILNEEMMTSELNQMQLLYQLNLFDKHRVSTKGNKNIFADDTAILSPVAKRAQREVFKVINRLRELYGEFDSIIIETTRDKNTDEKKKRIKEEQKRFEENNKEVNEILISKGYDPDKVNSKTKMKIRLSLQQNNVSAYSLNPIDLNDLLANPDAYEIDHIIPFSISLDDSFNNKVLVTHQENHDKGNYTPIHAFLVGELKTSLEDFKAYVKLNKNFSKKKKEYLLYEKDITKYSNMKEFIARNLVDTSYANRVVLNTLTQYFKDNGINTKVHTVRGSVTWLFRKNINLPKERDNDYLHHAIDALLVASIKKMNLLDSYLVKYNINDLYNEDTGELIKVEEDAEELDPDVINFISQIKIIYEDSFKYYSGMIEKENMKYKPIKISHKIDTKPNRQIADATINSTRKINGEEKLIKKYKNIYDPGFDKLTNDIIQGNEEKYLMFHNDIRTFNLIKDIILDHFNTYKDDTNIYSKKEEKGKTKYSLKGKNNPLYYYSQEHGKLRKYSKKNNGPEITSMNYIDGNLGYHIDISSNYISDEKKTVLTQISPYRTDFYVSDKGKYKMITIRYADIQYKKSTNKYVIDENWYNKQKINKSIDETYAFVCSLHHDELIGITKKDGDKFIYDSSTDGDGPVRYYDGKPEILKFTATNNDLKEVIEVKPIYTYTSKRLKKNIGTFKKIEKYSTDVLGNLYKVNQNVLKLEIE